MRNRGRGSPWAVVSGEDRGGGGSVVVGGEVSVGGDGCGGAQGVEAVLRRRVAAPAWLGEVGASSRETEELRLRLDS